MMGRNFHQEYSETDEKLFVEQIGFPRKRLSKIYILDKNQFTLSQPPERLKEMKTFNGL